MGCVGIGQVRIVKWEFVTKEGNVVPSTLLQRRCSLLKTTLSPSNSLDTCTHTLTHTHTHTHTPSFVWYIIVCLVGVFQSGQSATDQGSSGTIAADAEAPAHEGAGESGRRLGAGEGHAQQEAKGSHSTAGGGARGEGRRHQGGGKTWVDRGVVGVV